MADVTSRSAPEIAKDLRAFEETIRINAVVPGWPVWEQHKALLLETADKLEQQHEALEPFTHYDFHACQWIEGLTHEGHDLRAIWAETVDELIGHVDKARAALGGDGQ